MYAVQDRSRNTPIIHEDRPAIYQRLVAQTYCIENHSNLRLDCASILGDSRDVIVIVTGELVDFHSSRYIQALEKW